MQPGWMKDSGKIKGGNFESKYISTCKSSERDLYCVLTRS